jgi:hypothetical protein
MAAETPLVTLMVFAIFSPLPSFNPLGLVYGFQVICLCGTSANSTIGSLLTGEL